MARDNLNQLGKSLKNTQDKINFSQRRVAENFPKIERMRDHIGMGTNYKMEFQEDGYGSIRLTLIINDDFDPNAVRLFSSDVPLTISQTGLSIGKTGKLGSEGNWYPLCYMGDLSFESGEDYSAVFGIETYGTFTQSYKVSFTEGEVDVTGVTTITSTTVSVPMTFSNLVSPPNIVIHDVYVYGRMTSASAAAWIYYSTATRLREGFILYTPRYITVL